MPKRNARWHERHPMPRNATIAQRVQPTRKDDPRTYPAGGHSEPRPFTGRHVFVMVEADPDG
jgi:hypothetical protein